MTTKGTPARTIVGHGDAASEIVRIAETESADLIVIATHGMAPRVVWLGCGESSAAGQVCCALDPGDSN